MNTGLDRVFYGTACGAALWLFLLWAGMGWRRPRDQRLWRTGCALVTMLLLFVPVRGLPLWNWLFSFCPNPSLPLLGLVCGALWSRLGGVALLKPADWRAAVAFGAIAGTVLYLNVLLLPFVDLYYWGWHHEVAVWSMAVLALPALAWGNRVGVLVLAALMAYELKALESHNAWDYLVDPFYWLLSLGVVAVHGGRRLRTAWRARRVSRPPFPAPHEGLAPAGPEVAAGRLSGRTMPVAILAGTVVSAARRHPALEARPHTASSPNP